MDQDIAPYGDAIAAVESDGSGGYGAIGPTTKNGDYALGRYQVMASNVPQWTKDALGSSMTPKEFLNSPEAQDAVFAHKFGGYIQQYGTPQDAASAWFTGRPLAKGGNASDGYITGNEYVRRFNAALGKQQGNTAPTQIAPQEAAPQEAAPQVAPNNDASLSGLLSSPTTSQLAQQFGSGNGLLNVAPNPLPNLTLPGMTPVARALRQKILASLQQA